MAIRTLTTEGYQQVELTSELLHGSRGATQQVISTVPCTKHLPFFFSILLADIFLFGSVLLFAVYAAQYGDGFSLERQPEAPYRQFNVHALIMLVAFVYLNGQAITVYKSNYLVKHKSINMLYHFVLHLLTIGGILGGLYMTYNAQEAAQASRARVSHFYSMHSWTGLVAIGLFVMQFLFGFFSFFVTLCCRKLTARMRAKALPVHRVFAMIVLCASVAAVISGLTQLARFQMPAGPEGQAAATATATATAAGSQSGASKLDYRDLGVASVLVNLTGVSVLLATILIFFITFIFKRRQAHDLPILFKIILLVAQFVEVVLILVVAEFIFQLVTPHVHRAINGELMANTSLTHIFNNATASINSFIATASQHVTNLVGAVNASLADSSANSSASGGGGGSSILLGSTSGGSGGS